MPSTKLFDGEERGLEDVITNVGEIVVAVEDLRHNGPGHNPANKSKSRLTPNRGVLGNKAESTRDKRGLRSSTGLGASVDVVRIVDMTPDDVPSSSESTGVIRGKELIGNKVGRLTVTTDNRGSRLISGEGRPGIIAVVGSISLMIESRGAISASGPEGRGGKVSEVGKA